MVKGFGKYIQKVDVKLSYKLYKWISVEMKETHYVY